MKRKKVAILLPWLKMGGTNKVALRFIRQLIEFCDVTLVLSHDTGELMAEVPSDVHIVIDKMRDFKDILKEDILKLRIAYLIKDLVYYAKIKLKKDGVDNYKYLVERHPSISDEKFDCAISYHGQSPERLLNLVYRINAEKKVAWIHGEMSFSSETCEKMEKYYAKLDHFFFVSSPTMESFQQRIHVDATKCTVYYNPLDKDEIQKLADFPMETSFDKEWINILTVGRISSEKGQDMIPEITRKILDMGYKIRWYVIGDGGMRPRLATLIRENHVENYVILLGVQTNPYCYMKSCDIYVQPSYTEGYSTTICEAGILGKAIVGTKPSGGIRDQITDGKDGLIVDATVDGLTEGILEMIKDEDLRHSFELMIQKKNFSGEGEINKFFSYLSK